MTTFEIITAVIAVVTVTGMILRSVFTYLKETRASENWEKPLKDLRDYVDNVQRDLKTQVTDFETKVKISEKISATDVQKFDEIKSWILRMEQAIDQNANKFEHKIDDLTKLVIELIKSRKL